MNALELKRQRIERIVKIVALLGIAFFVSPFIFATIQGLVGLVVAFAIGTVAVNLAPWFAAKVANWRLKALKHEAALNPIETLEEQYRQREQGLIQYREDIKLFHAEVENFRAEVANHKASYPDDTTFDDKFKKMVALLQHRAAKYVEAQQKLADFNKVIERKRSEWKIAQAAARMDKAAKVGEDFISNLQRDTALTSIQTHLNSAFAELEVSLLDEAGNAPAPKPAAALPSTEGPLSLDLGIEVETVKAKA